MSLQNKMFPKLFTTRLHFSLPIDLTINLSLKNLCSKDEARVLSVYASVIIYWLKESHGTYYS